MSDLMQAILSVLALLGVGGIVGGYITHLLDKKKEREFKVLEQKQQRYKSCLVFMDAHYEPKNIKYLKSKRGDIDDAHDVIEYLKLEYYEMIFYASKEVVLSVKTFIENPVQLNFLAVILTMRRDFSGKESDLSSDQITLNLKSLSYSKELGQQK
jgi:hypothetical protein